MGSAEVNFYKIQQAKTSPRLRDATLPRCVTFTLSSPHATRGWGHCAEWGQSEPPHDADAGRPSRRGQTPLPLPASGRAGNVLETSQAESVPCTMQSSTAGHQRLVSSPFLPHLHTAGTLSMWANNTSSARCSPPNTHSAPSSTAKVPSPGTHCNAAPAGSVSLKRTCRRP